MFESFGQIDGATLDIKDTLNILVASSASS